MTQNKPYQINWDEYLSQKRERPESVTDPEKDSRNPFEVDFGKVVFCPALRRMHDKTQVIPLSSGDCVITRLTHSLQVMNIAESLACNYTKSDDFRNLYENNEGKAYEVAQQIRAILKTASLLHDIGNPPFGHFGEDTIQSYFKKLFDSEKRDTIAIKLIEGNIDFTQFDGNAQGLRLVSKLQYFGTLDGLNLTYGTLGAFLKYPNPKEKIGKKGGKYEDIGKSKHGVYKTERELFDEIVVNCHMTREDKTIKRHPLAFLVEAADTICYGTMDVEDGVYHGWYSLEFLLDELNKIISKKTNATNDFCKIIGYNLSRDEILRRDRRQVRIELREHIITYLVGLVITNFNEKIEAIDKGEYQEELIYKDDNHVAETLKEFSQKWILSNNNVLKFEITGNSVISGLFDILIKYFFHEDKSYRSRINGLISESRMAVAMKEDLPDKYPAEQVLTEEEIRSFDVAELSQYARLRMIVDFVSGMTDKFSVELYQLLSGNRL